MDFTLRCWDRVGLGNSRVLIVKLISELQKPKQCGADVKSEHKVAPINGLQKPCVHGRLILHKWGEHSKRRKLSLADGAGKTREATCTEGSSTLRERQHPQTPTQKGLTC